MHVLPRLNRLFARDGKCFDLAIDHGAFNEHDFLAGIEDMGKTVSAAIEAAPDAIQSSAAPLETALRLDAACVVVNLFYTPDRAELYHQCIQNVCAVRAECERFGMPLMVEPLVMLPGLRGAYDSDGHAGRLVPLVRQ